MFTKRIIPCLDVNNGRVVKGNAANSKQGASIKPGDLKFVDVDGRSEEHTSELQSR